MRRIFVPDAATMPTKADVVVVGGGIVGVATAFWLSRAGLDTVLVEMREGLSTLTTPLSIESFRGQMTEKAMAELVLPSIKIFEEFADVVGLPGHNIALKHQGYLFVSDDHSMTEKLQQAVGVHHGFGVPSEFLDQKDIQKRFPYISDRMVAGTFHQNDGWLSSHETTQGFAKGSTAKYLLKTKVTGIEVDGQGVAAVNTDRGTISTRNVVNAAGPFAQAVANMVGVKLPVDAVRRQKVYVSPKPQIPKDAPLCIDIGQEVYWRPEHGGALIAWVDPDEPATTSPVEEAPTDWDYAAVVLDKLTGLSLLGRCRGHAQRQRPAHQCRLLHVHAGRSAPHRPRGAGAGLPPELRLLGGRDAFARGRPPHGEAFDRRDEAGRKRAAPQPLRGGPRLHGRQLPPRPSLEAEQRGQGDGLQAHDPRGGHAFRHSHAGDHRRRAAHPGRDRPRQDEVAGAE